MKDLLVIGNGFDLYHGLPTRFSDFFNFIDNFELMVSDNEKEIEKIKDVNVEKYNFVKQFHQFYEDNKLKKEVLEIIKNYTHKTKKKFDNKLFEYWREIKNDRIIDNEIEWNNFEMLLDELLHIINDYFANKKILNQENSIKNNIENNMGIISLLADNIIDVIKYKFYETKQNIVKKIYLRDVFRVKKEEEILDLIYKNYKEFKALFTFYLVYFVNRLKVKKISSQILELNIFDDCDIVSFNYTEVPKIYNIKGSELYYVHGEAMAENFENRENIYNENDIVIGIPDNSFDDSKYVEFQKFFQRVMFKNKSFSQIKSFEYNNIYIFGHSLHNLDESILNMIFYKGEDDSKKITIFYKDDKDKKNKMLNIIKWYGKEKFINDTSSGRIVFEELKKPIF